MFVGSCPDRVPISIARTHRGPIRSKTHLRDNGDAAAAAAARPRAYDGPRRRARRPRYDTRSLGRPNGRLNPNAHRVLFIYLIRFVTYNIIYFMYRRPHAYVTVLYTPSSARAAVTSRGTVVNNVHHNNIITTLWPPSSTVLSDVKKKKDKKNHLRSLSIVMTADD